MYWEAEKQIMASFGQRTARCHVSIIQPCTLKSSSFKLQTPLTPLYKVLVIPGQPEGQLVLHRNGHETVVYPVEKQIRPHPTDSYAVEMNPGDVSSILLNYYDFKLNLRPPGMETHVSQRLQGYQRNGPHSQSDSGHESVGHCRRCRPTKQVGGDCA